MSYYLNVQKYFSFKTISFEIVDDDMLATPYITPPKKEPN